MAPLDGNADQAANLFCTNASCATAPCTQGCTYAAAGASPCPATVALSLVLKCPGFCGLQAGQEYKSSCGHSDPSCSWCGGWCWIGPGADYEYGGAICQAGDSCSYPRPFDLSCCSIGDGGSC